MTARAMYRASLRVGDERVGVKLYSAAQEKDVRFHLLHERDGVRVRQRMVHPATGETVPAEEVRRGVEVERGVYVLLSEEELTRLQPPSSRDIVVERCVAPEDLEHRWYERPYLLGPEPTQAARYFALAEALAASGQVGIVRWSMRNRLYNGALRLEGEHLALFALRHADELLPLEEVAAPGGRGLEERELALARQLVAALAGPFDPAEFKDEYRERLLAYIEEKRRGKKVKLHRFEPRVVRDDSLVAALEKSLSRAG